MSDDPIGATPTIRVRLRLFAVQRELAGTRALTVELTAPATVADAWDALAGRVPAIAPGRPFVRYAVNGSWADEERLLGDGDEVALIPPVSGGAATGSGAAVPGPGTPILELRSEPFEPDLLGRLSARLASPADGAVVAFLGRTRETPGTPAPGQAAVPDVHAGAAVEHLEYEAFEPLAIAVLGAIADEIRERFGVERLAIVHRTGTVPLGEPSIAIVACSVHRAEAFEAARYAIEETKARAPIWKAEHFADGHVWVGAPAREGPA